MDVTYAVVVFTLLLWEILDLFFETVIVIVISTLNTTHVSSIRFTLSNVKYVKKSHIFIASHYFSDIIVVEWRSIICYVNLP